MSMSPEITVKSYQNISDITQSDWDACTDGDPFTSYRFLQALEISGSVGDHSGWMPYHLAAYANDTIIGVMPLYLKSHSQGEYIFDHNWASAYENAGGRYYPKLQAAVPFTPVTGPRLLCQPEMQNIAKPALFNALIQMASQNNLSSAHVTFCDKEEFYLGGENGLLQRTSQQFHWINNDYDSFDGFLATLSSRKRKNIKKERKQAQSFGGKILSLTGDQIQPLHWQAFWNFYQDTGARKWGQPYLTRQFFDEIQETMRGDVLLVLAQKDDEFVAGALNFIGNKALYGRYWGCSEYYPAMHFELCYYQAIDYAISKGLSRVEAGAQGPHKIARGYMPKETYSLHWFRDEGFKNAIDNYLQAEMNAVQEEIEILTDYGPFKNVKRNNDV